MKLLVSFDNRLFRRLCAIGLVIYIFIVLWETLLGRKENCGVNMLTVPFWEYKQLFVDGKVRMLHDILLNIMMFIPIGILMPVCFCSNLKLVLCFAVFYLLALSADNFSLIEVDAKSTIYSIIHVDLALAFY